MSESRMEGGSAGAGRAIVPVCPLLPEAPADLTAAWMGRCRAGRDARFYLAALEYGQSLWLQGKPAQAILQLNKAWSAELTGDEEVLRQWPSPYRVLVWMLANSPVGRFLGNPVRHFQHLATRVRGEGAAVRSWRAWACFHLSGTLLPSADYPPDLQQIEREDLELPDAEQVVAGLENHGWPGEAELFAETLAEMSED